MTTGNDSQEPLNQSFPTGATDDGPLFPGLVSPTPGAEDPALEQDLDEPVPVPDPAPATASAPEAAAQEEEPPKLVVRATVSLPGLPLGATTTVDPRLPYIADCLERKFVVPVLEDEAPADA